MKMEKIAIIRIRGGIRVESGIADTLEMLGLYRQNYCVIKEKSPVVLGMVKKIKDYVTWGEVDDESIKMLADKRGEKDPKDANKLKKFFRLNPPRGGFERKGIKKSFTIGGALGYRGEKIKDLIQKMI